MKRCACFQIPLPPRVRGGVTEMQPWLFTNAPLNAKMLRSARSSADSNTDVCLLQLPMVLKVPRLNSSPLALCDRPFSLLGFGDILVPGNSHQLPIKARIVREGLTNVEYTPCLTSFPLNSTGFHPVGNECGFWSREQRTWLHSYGSFSPSFYRFSWKNTDFVQRNNHFEPVFSQVLLPK